MCKLLKQFLRSQEGSVIPLVGLVMVSMIGAIGAAVDTGRAQLVQAKLSSSLDAAGLAAGSTVSTMSIEEETNKYLNANFNGYMGATLYDVSVVANDSDTVFALSASATAPTTFMRLLGQETISVRANSEVTRAISGLELVLVLDNTGSMNCPVSGYCGSTSTEQANSKLAAAKSAATDLINIMYGDKETVEDLWVGLVPFSQTVNIGTSRTSWTTADASNWGPTSWGGCVDARETSNRDTTDDPPSVATFPKYYWPDHDDKNNWISTSTNTTGPNSTTICNKKSTCTCANYGPCTTTTSTSGNTTTSTTISCNGSGNNKSCTRSVTTTTTTTNYTINSTKGPNRYCPQEVTPMSGDKSAVLTGIDDMEARGNTHIVLGAAWGWRMLSPRWQGLWGGDMDENGLPQEYNTPRMNKAVIIMTDGDNSIDNSNHGAYWYLSDGKLGTTNASTAETRLDTRLGQVCTSMKNNNIIVYTISFGSVSSTSQTMLRNCATQSDFYFPSPNNATLQASFRAIGDSLSNLRVSK